MKISCLVENTSHNTNLKPKHGISFYIETLKHKILFDTGSDSLFLDNAEKMGIDIKSIDTLVISHGHIDHGGGLGQFLDKNKIAKVFVRPSAFDKHTTKVLFFQFDVGLDKKIKQNDRIILTDEKHRIDDELTLFVTKNRKFPLPFSNKKLYKQNKKQYIEDDFLHEQSLLIFENEKVVVLGGCAHSGVVNILDEAISLANKKVDVLVSGFHLYNPITKKNESIEYIEKLGNELIKYDSLFYTCHCTGENAFGILSNQLSQKLKYISTGQQIELQSLGGDFSRR